MIKAIVISTIKSIFVIHEFILEIIYSASRLLQGYYSEALLILA